MAEKHHTDNAFREKLGSFEKTPPEETWMNIADQLKRERKLVLITFAWKTAAGFALLFSLGLTWYLVNENHNRPDVFMTEQLPENSPAADQEKAIVSPHVPIEEQPELKAKTAFIKPESNKKNTMVNSESLHDSGHQAVQLSSDKKVAAQTLIAENLQKINKLQIPLPQQITPHKAKSESIEIKKPSFAVSWDMLITDNTESSEKDETWLLTAMAAPEYSYRSVRSGTMAPAGYFDNSEKARLSYSGGIQLGYKISKRLNFHSGLVYSRSGIDINNIISSESIALNDFIDAEYRSSNGISYVNIGNSMGNIVAANPSFKYLSYNNNTTEYYSEFGSQIDIVTNSPASRNSIDAGMIQYLDFIEVPFNLSYRIYEGRFNINFMGGMSSNVLVGNKVMIKTEGEKIQSGRTENLRSFNYSGNLGFSFDFEMSEKFLLLLEPRYKYYLHSINQDQMIDARPYMFGVFTGLRYRF
jgi:hypothetical protein